MTGRKLGRFEILEQIGEGGMGVVFKARDTHLDRIVALKILPTSKVSDSERRRRFTLEAKAASALNHPGIVTIHDIDTAEGESFIAMEFVQGRTLSQWIKSSKRNLKDALRYAVQIAEALTAAHAAGIIHRDLKPGNVMITGEGQASRAKVLDFGLAKLMDTSPGPTDATRTMAVEEPGTGEGVVVGTTAYMSPEQAEGKAVDARSDIFSFGSVLYEMVTGRRAFHGDTALSTLSAILKDDPKPVSQLANDVPPEVERVISRCLRKDVAKRFQHMDDLNIALEELLEESSSGTLAAVKPSPAAWTRWLWPAVAGLAVAGAAIGWMATRERAAPAKNADLKLRQLTFDAGLTTDPTVWPAGRMIAYASDRAGGGLDIWVQHLDTNETRRLTTHPADESEPSFSPDGTRVAYHSSRDGGGVYTVSTLGGEERKIAQPGRSPRYSPDGKWIAYWVGTPVDVDGLGAGGEIYVIPSQGGAPRRVGAKVALARSPIWSPDGKRLLFRAFNSGYWNVAAIDSDTATPVLTGEHNVRQLTRRIATWWDGNRIYFSASSGDARSVWTLPLDPVTLQAAGPAERLTVGSATAEDSVVFGGQLLYTNRTENPDIWMLPIETNTSKVTGEPKRITTDVSPEWNCGITPDGARVVYVSQRSGQVGIHLHDLQSGRRTKLLEAPNLALWARINRDATLVAYSALGEGRVIDTNVLDIASGSSRKLCDQCQLRGFSGDGARVWVSLRESDGPPATYRHRLLNIVDGKEQLAITSTANAAPRASADDRWLAIYNLRPGGTSLTRMLIAPLGPGTPPPESEWIQVTDGNTYDVVPEFSLNGQYLYFQSGRDGFRCIWALKLDVKTKKPLGTPFAVQHFHNAQRSPGYTGPGRVCNAVAGDKIAFTMSERTGNIWIAELPKQ